MNNIWQTAVLIRDKEGKTITSIEGQIQSWNEYLEEILNTSASLTEKEKTASPSSPTEIPIRIRPLSKR
jgi:hypothetical protein